MRKQLMLAGLAVMIAGTAVFEATTRSFRGWQRDEAFFRGRPTSYWSGELAHWRLGFT